MHGFGIRRRFFALLFAALATVNSATATDFYIDPIAGNPSPMGDGSAANPWRTLQEVVEDNLIETQVWASLPYEPGTPLVVVNAGAPVKAGDTLWLRTGYHGELEIRGAYNAAPITIAPQAGHQPRLGRIDLTAVQHWVFRGLSISPSHASPTITPGTIVRVDNHGFWGPTWDVGIRDCDIFTIADASAWGVDAWINDAASGISVGGTRVTIRGNTVRNVRFGITVGGDEAVISRNVIDGFSADGMRGLGDGSVYEYNRIQNCYASSSAGDGNHDDGFQSWSVGPGGVGTGEVRDVVLRGNIFINHLNPSHPLRSTMQGIGCFGGLYVNWVVENNVVITDHWHGITFHGMIDSRIVNNTTIDINDTTPGPPWIRVTSSNGTPSQNVVVRNNLATDYSLSGTSVTDDHNIEFSDANAFFVAPPYNLHLVSGAMAVDAGSPSLAPPHDLEGLPRPQGAAPDLGAYERCEACIFFDGFETGDTGAWTTGW